MYLHKDVFIGIFTAISNSSTVFPAPSVSIHFSMWLKFGKFSSQTPQLPSPHSRHPCAKSHFDISGWKSVSVGKTSSLWCFWIPPDCCSMYTIHISVSDFLEAVRKNWHNFLGASGWVIIHCMYVAHLPYPFICEWSFWWFPMLDSLGSPAGDTGVQVYWRRMVFSG